MEPTRPRTSHGAARSWTELTRALILQQKRPMQFLEPGGIRDWCLDRGFHLDASGELTAEPRSSVLAARGYGQQTDPQGQESETAAWCIDALQEWDECLLWVTQWGVWPSSENWPAYYQARGAQGERRSLEVAPGHLFAASETGLLKHFVRLVLENAWDAHVLASRDGKRIGTQVVVSHDEWVEIREMPMDSTRLQA